VLKQRWDETCVALLRRKEQWGIFIAIACIDSGAMRN
jgi:hypothetical protein